MPSNVPDVKPLFTYLLLVGLPVMGLLAVLNAGRQLQAPPPLGGVWRTLAAGAGHDGLAALMAASESDPRRIEVQQSGAYVSVVIGSLRLSGELRGDSLVAASATPVALARADGCGKSGEVELRAVLDRVAQPERLTAVLAVSERPACPRVHLAAERQVAGVVSSEKGGH